MKLYPQGTILGGILVLTFAVGAVALASPGGGHGKRWNPERMEQHMNEMIQQLDLSAAQESQIRAIMADTRTRMEAIHEMPRSEAKFEAARDLRFATEDQIYANLSCEQREQLRLLKREHKAERMQKHWQRRQADRPAE